MKDPAFLFYSNDFLSGTMLMTDADVGRYIKLLCLQHQQGHLTKEDMLNMRATPKVFSKFKVDEEGKYFNERLEYEANRRKAYSESRRNNRKKKSTKDEDMKNICNSYEEHMENEIEIINKNKSNKKEVIQFAEFVSMTNAEYEKLVSTYGKDFVNQCITTLDNYKGSSGKKYKSDYRAILNWVIEKLKEPKKNKKAYQDYEQRDITNFDNFYAN